MTNWNDLSLSAEMLSIIEQAGYKAPTPVQAQSIPLVVAGHDVLVSSQTGSGKTASFVIPVVEKFKGKNGTYILALSPTREIAQQTGAVFETFGKPLGLRTVVCIGGASIPVEKEALASSPHIIVATPGRLCDHLERGNVWLDFIQCLIFDEADRMLEMGFAKQIDTITEQIPKERQTLMFSATFAPKVEKLAKNVMNDPKQVTIVKTEESAPKIDQNLFWIPEERKMSTLMRLAQDEPGTIIIFAKSKERVYQVWRSLHGKKDDVTYIHSDLGQKEREAAIADFKSGRYRILVATDVMGRGIDVDDVGHVVNYDVPREPEDYIHRIGRTGRRGKSGAASTFAVPGKDDLGIKAIEKLRGIEPSAKPPERESRDDRPAREDRSRGNPRRGDAPKVAGPKTERSPRPPREQQGPRNPESTPRPPRKPTVPAEKLVLILREDLPAHRAAEAAKAAAAEAASKKSSGGIVGWFKKLFS